MHYCMCECGTLFRDFLVALSGSDKQNVRSLHNCPRRCTCAEFCGGFFYIICLATHLEQLKSFCRVRITHTVVHGLSNVKRHENIHQKVLQEILSFCPIRGGWRCRERKKGRRSCQRHLRQPNFYRVNLSMMLRW